jgi:hypothetical protein
MPRAKGSKNSKPYKAHNGLNNLQPKPQLPDGYISKSHRIATSKGEHRAFQKLDPMTRGKVISIGLDHMEREGNG